MSKRLIASLVAGILCVVCNVQSQSMQRKTPQSSPPARGQVLRSQPGGVVGSQPLTLESINDILWWLPEDTETVSVVRGPFKVPSPIEEPPANITAIEYADLVLRTIPLGVFQTIDKGRFYTPLVGGSVLFCIEGSRRFRPPTDLGKMLYEGCDIIILQEGLSPAPDVLIKQLRSKATQVQTIAGQQVMLFEERLEDDTWKFFVAIPAPNVLLCATNRDYLTQVLNRMQQKGQKRALPEDLPEWKHVNTAAKFWAVRHYDKDDAKLDPSSPLSGVQKGANWPDKQAVGIVFELDPSRSPVATLYYLSANQSARKIFADTQAKVDRGFKPEFRESEPGVIEMRFSLDDPKRSGMFLFVLLFLLGHGVYV
jgi:hypothetical protein